MSTSRARYLSRTTHLNRGDSERLTGTFKNQAGTLTDPTTVEYKVRAPDGTITTYTWAGAMVTRDSTGVFHRDITFLTSGKWVVRVAGAGAVASVSMWEYMVSSDPFE